MKAIVWSLMKEVSECSSAAREGRWALRRTALPLPLPLGVDAGDQVVGPGVGAVVAVLAQPGRVAALVAGRVVAVVAVELLQVAR